ncbi:polysaccharide deacetylase family protein [Paenibacillus woosongensis]|uniref:Polysaccharide deacetylase family protein n=1 Tax=Paenibacillus woosongensis TaxID=307580 RepID=A0A7X2Z0U1_9BACL|nr:polysaccharide deacetylase family protein [Paenibacillus woosongensis]MUG44948.1 polysaccharide deacetylase family protein [Paenibacillus woosongensis]
MSKYTRWFIPILILTLVFPLIPHPMSAHPASQFKDRAYYEERGDIVWEVPTEDKCIAFTFDDGPDHRQTQQILDVLDQYNAKATFFVVGERVEKHPEIVKMQLAKGHEIGNHSYRHPSFQGLSKGNMHNELSKTQQAIYQATGYKAVLFRPPGGFYNETLINVSKANELKFILWSWHQDTKDWRSPGVNRIVKKVLTNARSGDIVLMHDYVANSTQTVEALKQILPELKKQGYSFVTVTELLTHKAKAQPDHQLKKVIH